MKQGNKTSTKLQYKILAILFWIILWQIASMIINKEMLLASPFAVMRALIQLIPERTFLLSILFSFSKITLGFLLAIILGTILATLSFCSVVFYELVSPLIKIMKATPVASFIILALLWVRSSNLSILISFLMVIPIIYINVLQGLSNTDKKLLEMAKVFRIGLYKRIRYIYIPSVKPHFTSACTIGIGFCWKSGIAAEVIGLPKNSIGEQLYEAKLYLMTKELFAWTFVIILISVIFEKLVIWLIGLPDHLVSKTKKQK